MKDIKKIAKTPESNVARERTVFPLWERYLSKSWWPKISFRQPGQKQRSNNAHTTAAACACESTSNTTKGTISNTKTSTLQSCTDLHLLIQHLLQLQMFDHLSKHHQLLRLHRLLCPPDPQDLLAMIRFLIRPGQLEPGDRRGARGRKLQIQESHASDRMMSENHLRHHPAWRVRNVWIMEHLPAPQDTEITVTPTINHHITGRILSPAM